MSPRRAAFKMPSVVFSNICSTRGLGFGAYEAGEFGDREIGDRGIGDRATKEVSIGREFGIWRLEGVLKGDVSIVGNDTPF